MIATAFGIPLLVPGTVYVLQPEAADAATLGIVLRPTGGIPLVGKIFAVAHVTAVRNADGDYFLRNTLTGLPDTAKAIGFITVPITIQWMTLNLKKAGNTSSTYFLTNPTGCQAAVARVQAVSDTNATANAQTSYTPTGCGSVPFTPAFDFQTSTTQAGASTATTATITVPGNEHTLRQSHVKSVQLKFPPGMGMDILAAFGFDVCSDAAFAADTCGTSSDLGNASAAVPPLPPDFTGDVYRVNPPPGELYGFGVVLRGPRGVKATMRGGASITSVPTPGRDCRAARGHVPGVAADPVHELPARNHEPAVRQRAGVREPLRTGRRRGLERGERDAVRPVRVDRLLSGPTHPPGGLPERLRPAVRRAEDRGREGCCCVWGR